MFQWHSSFAIGATLALTIVLFQSDMRICADQPAVPIRRINATVRYETLALSPDGKSIAAVCAETALSPPQLQLLTLHDGAQMWSAELSDEVGGLSFSPDGKLVAVSHHRSTKNGDDLVIQLWNVATGKVVSALAVETGIKPGKSAGPVGFSKDGKYLAAISLEGQARVFALPTGREHLRLEHFPERDHANYKEPIATFAFASDGKTIATGSTRMVAIWDLESGKQRTILREETTLKAGVRAFLPVFADVLAFSPDGTMLAVGRLSGTVKLWDLKTQKVAFEVRGPGINAETLCYSPNGKLLAKAGRQGAGGLGVWELSTRKLVFASAGSGAVGSAGSGAKPAFFTPDGRYLVAIENVVFAVRTGGRAFGILIFDLGGLGPAKSG